MDVDGLEATLEVVDLAILRTTQVVVLVEQESVTEEVGLVAVDVIVFDVVTEVVVATSGADDVTDEDWLCVVTEEVVVAAPGADDVTDGDWLCVVTEEVVVATPDPDDVADEEWLRVVTEEVVVATPGTDDVADEDWLCVVTEEVVCCYSRDRQRC